MAGALFVISLPTACYETANRPVVAEEANPDTKNKVSENVKYPSSVAKNNLLKSKSYADISAEDTKKKVNTEFYDASKTLNRMESKTMRDPISRSKNLPADHSVSTPAMQNVDSFVVDMNGIDTKTPTLPRSVPPDSTTILISDLVGTPNKSTRGSEKSILNVGKKLVTALTPTKGTTTPDAVSTTSKPDTTVPLETLLLQVLEKVGVENAVWNTVKNGNFYQVYFSVESGDQCEECIAYLNECGFGIRPSTTVSVIPCTLYYKGEEEEEIKKDQEATKADEMEQDQKLSAGCSQSAINGDDDGLKVWDWNKFVASVRARLTVAEVVESVRANAELTFDFIMLLLVAGMVAALGLVENSSVVLVASMLISPLMGPILAATFGTVIQDRQLQKIGVFNELLGLALCITVGFIFGLVIGCSSDHYSYSDASEWPTSEMYSRGVFRCLWVGLLIALPSGAGVALSVLGGNAGSLVGVAISASLLPPAVNAGLLWALSLIKALSSPQENELDRVTVHSTNKAVEYATLGAVSLCLTLVNIACIYVAAVLVLKVKEVAPQLNRDAMKRFWKHDVKIARDYNRTLHGEDASNIGKQLLEELGGISQDQMEALMEEAAHGMRRFSITRHISESGVPGGNKDSIDSLGLCNNQRTWTPGTISRYSRPRFHPEFRRKSVSVPSDEEVENLVYSTLTAGSKLGLFRSVGRSGTSARPPYRKISSMSLPVNSQIRSPTRTTTIEPHLDTIKESNTSLFPVLDTLHVPHSPNPTRFQVTRCAEDNSSHGRKSIRPSKAPLAKRDE